MILRKPYAILIKYFKIIHIVMCIMFVYLVFSLRKIYFFFSNYIKAGNFTYVENMVDIYVPLIIFIIVLVLLVFSISIFLLMRKKEKPVLFYKIMIAYCIFLLIVFIYFMIFYKSLDTTVYEPLRIVVNRDISLFAYIFNFFFVIFTFIRGFGFDIKKFSFDKDKRELNLEDSDSEEYELNVGIEKDDVKSFINKQRRELRYYFKENKKFFIIVSIIAVLSLGLYFYYDIFVINKVYKEEDDIKIGSLTYRVNGSRISDIDKYGRVIDSSSDYLIIDVSIKMESGKNELDEQALRVHIDDDYYYPHSSSCDLFTDLGNCYNKQEIEEGSTYNYIFVYKIKKNHEKIFLEILKNKGDEYQYSKVELLYKMNEATDIFYNLNEEVYINGNSIIVKDVSFHDKTSYQYEECISDKCNSYIKRVNPNTGEVVLSIEISGLDMFSEDFVSSAFGIKNGDKTYTGNDIHFIARNGNYLYYSVPMYLQNEDNINLVINTRLNKYNFILSEVVNE